MRFRLLWAIGLILVGSASFGSEDTQWWDQAWTGRLPVQVKNTTDQEFSGGPLIISGLNPLCLINSGKLLPDGGDLRLIDEQNNPLPLHALNLLSDNGDDTISFLLDSLPPRSRRLLYLYFGNKAASPSLDTTGGERLTSSPQANAEGIFVTLGGEETKERPLPPAGPDLPQWLRDHILLELEEFDMSAEQWNAQPPPNSRAASGNAIIVPTGGRATASKNVRIDREGEYKLAVRFLAVEANSFTLKVEREGSIKGEVSLPAKGSDGFQWGEIRASLSSGTASFILETSTRPLLDCLVYTTDLSYCPDYRDFTGRVWSRFRIDEPKSLQYQVGVENEINPYKPTFETTGTVTYFGLHPPKLSAEGEPRDYLLGGDYSGWVLLAASTATQWGTCFNVKPRAGQSVGEGVRLRLEFANRPSEQHIFHIVEELTTEAGSASVRMPTGTRLEDLAMLESFTEWARRRYLMVQGLHLGPPPRLKKIRVGTWVHMGPYRGGGGNASLERAQQEFETFEALGINSVSAGGISDEMFRQMANGHAVIDTTLTEWTSAYQWSGLDLSWHEGEGVEQHYGRLFEELYGRGAESTSRNSPFSFSIAKHINMGDEIGPATSADEIQKTPQLLSYLRRYLQEQGVRPADLGAATWAEVLPSEDRTLASPNQPIENRRRFYWTRRFINYFTGVFYRLATEKAQRYFPNGEMFCANYQAGPAQIGFIGNDNDMDRANLDVFEVSRLGGFHGVMLEDWVGSSDLGAGMVSFASAFIRGVARKRDLPLAAYLVGHWPRVRFYSWLMESCKEIGLYLYGPITNIGPAWGEHKETLAQIAECTREVAKFEDLIYEGRVRRPKAALLLANTSDIMQVKGLYFTSERQHLYIALKHSYIPVDTISEQEILEDDILNEYSVLYLTDPQIRAAVQQKIRDWVQGGGFLWAEVGAANWDEFSQPSSVLNEVFGVSKNEMVCQENWLLGSPPVFWQTGVGKFDLSPIGKLITNGQAVLPKMEIPVWGARLDCLTSTGHVLATYEDGKPAAFYNRFGAGQALLAGALIGEAYVNAHWPPNLKPEELGLFAGENERYLAGIPMRLLQLEGPVILSIPGIYTSVMEAFDGWVVFLNNASDKPIEGVTVQVAIPFRPGAVESAKQGPLNFEVKEGRVVFSLPLFNSDIVALTPANR